MRRYTVTARSSLWDEHAVLSRAGGTRDFQHPRQGRSRYEQIALTPSGAPDFKLVMLLAVKIWRISRIIIWCHTNMALNVRFSSALGLSRDLSNADDAASTPIQKA
jgi:hypothetical protein